MRKSYVLIFGLSVLAMSVAKAGGPSVVHTRLSAKPEVGYQIEVELTSFTDSLVFLANYFMDKQYIVDTAVVVDGRATFSDPEALAEGMYLLVLPPNNDYAQLLIDGDQHFKLKADAKDLTTSMRVSGHAENERFFTYLQLLENLRPQADSLRGIAQDSSLSAKPRADAKAKVDKIDQQVKDEQARIKRDFPQSMLSSLLRSFDEVEMPTFSGSPEEMQRQQYLFYKAHYFDFVNLGDPRALRSTYLDQRVTYYLDKLVVPSPDSISKEIDFLLDRMRPAPETFRAYVSKFLNQFAASKVVGQDAVYAHLGEKYYMSGQTPWVDSTTLSKIADNVKRLKPLLIGQPAPQLKTYLQDGSPMELYSVDAAITVLFFFDPECGVCKKQTPDLLKFAKDFAGRNVKVVSVCTMLGQQAGTCWPYANDKPDMKEFVINTNDPFHRSGFKTKYDINATPQIYVLDRDKTIVSKRIASEQLAEVVGRLLEMEKGG